MYLRILRLRLSPFSQFLNSTSCLPWKVQRLRVRRRFAHLSIHFIIPVKTVIVNKADQSRSLANLTATEGFGRNNSGMGALRVGIDASLWFHRAEFSKGGENPELRPKNEAGKLNGGVDIKGMKKLLGIFGMEWRMNWAHLNSTGIIDAAIIDDVDALVFGALRIIKNPSPTLSGNKSNHALNSDGKATKDLVVVYTATAIWQHPDIQMSRGGFILFGLLVKGGYSEGVIDIGKQTAHAFSRCGFGDELLAIFHQRDDEDIRPALARWCTAVNAELNTNSRKLLRHAHPSSSLPGDFASGKNADPVCSAEFGLHGAGEINVAHATEFCYRSVIVKRFQNVLWEAVTIRVLRRATLEADDKEWMKRLAREDVICIPSSFIDKYFGESGTQCRRPVLTNCDPGVHRDLITKIASSRNHASTDRMLEYRIEIPPSQLVQIALMSIRGMRPLDPLSVSQQNPSSFSYCTPKNVPHDSDSTIRLWVPASMMDEVHPNLVAEYEDKLTREAQGSQTKCTKGSERGGQERDKSTIPLPSPTCHPLGNGMVLQMVTSCSRCSVLMIVAIRTVNVII
ncbi:hypothetical protein V8B97DRAFT_2020885 [Scleroderma yunnanense]